MTQLKQICSFLESFAPVALAEDWDNVGLLVGDPQESVFRIMTCLTVTPESAEEAIEGNANLIITHHPMPFRSLNRLTADQTVGRILLDLIRAGIAIYSPHTAFDSARSGINQQLTEKFELTDARPLVTGDPQTSNLGSGRVATAPRPLRVVDLAEQAKQLFQLDQLQLVGNPEQSVRHVAFACGSGGSFLEHAIDAGCQALVTGETTFHTCLEAKARNVSLILLGHYTSERFAVESLANQIQATFPEIEVWASQRECDPLLWV